MVGNIATNFKVLLGISIPHTIKKVKLKGRV